MIDVIIPSYNAHETISQSLASIAIQTIKNKCRVYIVDDCSDVNYDREIDSYKDILDIVQLRTERNRGAGYARQYGIDHSSSEYILFLDSDDLLHDCFSLEKLYDTAISCNSDLVAGAYYNEGKTLQDSFVVVGDRVFGCLHGKLYRRKYLEDNNIRFNYTRYSEDNSFGGIVANTSNKIKVINDVVYVYKFNKNSLTSNHSKLVKIHTSYLHNMLWLAKQLEKRGVPFYSIERVMLNSYVYMFHEVMCNDDVDFQNMYNQCFMFEEYFKKILEKINIEELMYYLNLHFQNEMIDSNNLLDEFMQFRSLFKKKGVLND